MRKLLAACIAALAILVLCAPAQASSFTPQQRAEIVQIMRDALRNDPSLLRDAITGLQQDDQDRQQAATSAAIKANHAQLFSDPADQVAGNPQGDVTLVEFYDTRCPYCRGMLPIIAELLRRDPHLRLVYKDLPVLGPASVMESRALLAAARQNGYARLQNVIMQMPPHHDMDDRTLRQAVRTAGLDIDRLETDTQDPAIQAHIERNLQLAQALQIEGTPALVIGTQMLAGATDLETLRRAVAAARH